MIEVNIDGKEKFYPIIFDKSNLSEIKTLILDKVGDERFVVVISKKVYSLYKNILNSTKTLIFLFSQISVIIYIETFFDKSYFTEKTHFLS